MNEEAVDAVEQEFLEIFWLLYPEVTWTIRPRSKRNAPPTSRQIVRRIAAPDEAHALAGKAA